MMPQAIIFSSTSLEQVTEEFDTEILTMEETLVDVLCANYGSGQSMDCAAQSMDLCFARAIHGLRSTCAIHGSRNHTCVKHSCKRRKGPRWSVERKERKSLLTFRLAITKASKLWTTCISANIAGCNTSDIELRRNQGYLQKIMCYWGLLLLVWSLHALPSYYSLTQDSYNNIHLMYLNLAASANIFTS